MTFQPCSHMQVPVCLLMLTKGMTMKKYLIPSFALISIGFAPVSLATNGYQLTGVGSYQESLAGAVTASPGSAMTAITNPAGMARIGKRARPPRGCCCAPLVRARGETLAGRRVDIEMTLAPLTGLAQSGDRVRLLGLYQPLSGAGLLQGRPVWRHRLTSIFPPDLHVEPARLKLVANND